MTTFHLIRHGEKQADDQVIVGRTPGIHLSPRGRAQANVIARRLASSKIKHVFSSPRERAQETAEPIAALHGVAVRVSESFEELHFGEWTGQALSELDLLPDWRRFNSFRSAGRPPGGETMLEVQARFVGEMLRLKGVFADDEIVLVSHGDPIRLAINYFLGAPIDLFHRVEISVGSISEVALTDNGATVLRLNEVPEQ